MDNDDDEAYLMLLLTDSSLPTGSFIASSGLESYLTHGFGSLSPNPTFAFIQDSLPAYARSTLPFVSDAHRVVSEYRTAVGLGPSTSAPEMSTSLREHGTAGGPVDGGGSSEKGRGQHNLNFTADASSTPPITSASAFTPTPTPTPTATTATTAAATALSFLSQLDDLYECTVLNPISRRASKSQGVALLTLFSKGFSRPPSLLTPVLPPTSTHHDGPGEAATHGGSYTSRIKNPWVNPGVTSGAPSASSLLSSAGLSASGVAPLPPTLAPPAPLPPALTLGSPPPPLPILPPPSPPHYATGGYTIATAPYPTTTTAPSQQAPDDDNNSNNNNTERLLHALLDNYKLRVRREDSHGHLPICWGVLTAALGLKLERAQYLHLFLHARSLLSASVRLNQIGPYGAQQLLLHAVRPLVGHEAGKGRDLQTGLLLAEGAEGAGSGSGVVEGSFDDRTQGPASTWPLGEILAARHDLQHSRIFNS